MPVSPMRMRVAALVEILVVNKKKTFIYTIARTPLLALMLIAVPV